MTATLISILSIFIGIIGANISGLIFKESSFGFTGNTIAGVFGSTFLIKSLGRIGFSPKYIVHYEHVNYSLFSINILVSFIGGFVAVILIYKLKEKLNTSGLNTQH